MTTTDDSTRRGRPRKDIHPLQVQKLAAIGCTMTEIGTVVGCDRATLQRRFTAAIEKGRAEAKVSLRRAQYKAAMKGNPAMLIWLGKQYLWQTDKLPDFSKLSDEELIAMARRLSSDEFDDAVGDLKQTLRDDDTN